MIRQKKAYRSKNIKPRDLCLTLLTDTCVNAEQYGGQREALGPLMAVVCKCETDTDSTGSNGYGQPQAVAAGCDIVIPYHVRVVG
jgi:hypothetical protein